MYNAYKKICFNMFKRRKKRVKLANVKTKNKITCCRKCRRKIRKWLCRRIKRCVKKKVFGTPDPQLDDFEIAGINLGSVRDNLKLNKSQEALNKDTEKLAENKPTVITLFRNNLKKSTKSIPMKNAFIDAINKYFVPQPLVNRVKSFVYDFKERNLSLDVLKDSQLFLNKEEKSWFKKLAKKYENKRALLKSYENLKKKFPLTASKSIIFRNMMDDYKKGTLSFTDLTDKQLMDVNNMKSQDLNKLLLQYESKKKQKIYSKFKNFSVKNLELLRNMNSHDLKNEFSLTDSKYKMLGNMIDDYKKGKISLTALQRDIKNDKKILNKENINQMLNYYKEQKKWKHQSIVKQSKFKQLKSDLRAKIDSL